MHEHMGAALVGRVSRALPSRRWQASHWVGKLLVPLTPFIGRVHNGLLEVHPGEVASTSTFVTGFYEREVTMWCREQIRTQPPALVVDVGANFGYYPLLFGLLTAGKTEVIAYEPDPANYAWLARNLALNPGLRVSAVPMAVGDIDGAQIAFETALDGHNLWSRASGFGANEHASTTVNVTTTTLDADLDRRGITEVPLTLIDVEGYESKVLEGMAGGIRSARYQTVMIEFHPWAFADPVAEIAGIIDRFQNAGYVAHRFEHYASDYADKDPKYYDLTWDASILGPPTWDKLSSWEHYLFTYHRVAEVPV